jgi:DNA repair and recombination RAD54-like protein
MRPLANTTQFLYRATTGLIDPNANGCIMADEMGLGKTVSRLSCHS